MTTASIKETTSVKLDKKAKEEARKIFKQLGISMGDAFNMFLYQVSLHKGIPFELKIPNEETQQAIQEARAGTHVDELSLDELEQLKQ